MVVQSFLPILVQTYNKATGAAHPSNQEGGLAKRPVGTRWVDLSQSHMGLGTGDRDQPLNEFSLSNFRNCQSNFLVVNVLIEDSHESERAA